MLAMVGPYGRAEYPSLLRANSIVGGWHGTPGRPGDDRQGVLLHQDADVDPGSWRRITPRLNHGPLPAVRLSGVHPFQNSESRFSHAGLSPASCLRQSVPVVLVFPAARFQYAVGLA